MLGQVRVGRVVYLRSNRVGPAPNLRNQLHLHNHLEQELQKFLRPLNLSGFVLLSSRYYLRDNFITPNNSRYRCCSFLITFCFVVTYITALVFSDDIYYFQSLLMTIFLINHVCYIIRIIFNSIFNAICSDTHVSLIINIQRLQKSFKFVKINYREFIIGNWVYVCIIYILFVIFSVIHIYLGNFTLTLFMCYVVLLLDDLNILYMIRIVKLFTHSITLSIMELTRVSEIIVNNGERNEERVHTEHWMRLVTSYLDTLDCLHVYRKFNEVMSFCYMCIIFLNSLTNVQILIANSSKTTITVISTVMWILKQTVLLFLMSFESERLYMTLKNSQITFTMKIVDIGHSDIRTAYKRLCNASKVACSILRDSGVISVNATLPLTLISVIASYAVVLLQIAFL